MSIPPIGGRVWAATYGGVWRSDDYGSNWASHDGDLPIINAADIARDSGDSDALYLATWRGLFKTEDGGIELDADR